MDMSKMRWNFDYFESLKKLDKANDDLVNKSNKLGKKIGTISIVLFLVLMFNAIDIFSTWYLLESKETTYESNFLVKDIVETGRWDILFALKWGLPLLGLLYKNLENRKSFLKYYMIFSILPVLNNLFYLKYGV